MSEGTPATLGATRLIGDSFRLLFAHFGILFPLALAPVLLVQAALVVALPEADPTTTGVAVTPGLLIVSLLSTLVGYLVMAMLCLATLDCVAGGRRGLGAYLRGSAAHLVPLFVLGTILSIAAGLATVFFLIPGLYVLAQFLVWVPTVVIEGRGMRGLGRAQSLTGGHRWPLVGALVILMALMVGGLLITIPVFAMAAGGAGELIVSLGGAALEALFYAVISIYATLVYLRLRQFEDGTGAAEIAARVG